MPTLSTENIEKRLRWQCRRGMLELDILLERYLETSYAIASQEEKDIFRSLLSENDQNLFLWLVKREKAPEKYGSMVEQLVS